MKHGVDYSKVKPAKKRRRGERATALAVWEVLATVTHRDGRRLIVDDPSIAGRSFRTAGEAESAARVASEAAKNRGWPDAVRYEVVAA